MSRPRFTVSEHEHRVMIYDDDFGFDAALRISGDFVDDEKKIFAQAIAAVLNASVDDIPTADSMRAAARTPDHEATERLIGTSDLQPAGTLAQELRDWYERDWINGNRIGEHEAALLCAAIRHLNGHQQQPPASAPETRPAPPCFWCGRVKDHPDHTFGSGKHHAYRVGPVVSKEEREAYALNR